VFLDNHDMSRFYSVVGENFDKFKAGMALLLTMRGIPQMYYGDELLMSGYSNPDGLVRADFPGGFPGDKVNKFTQAGRTEKENEAFNYIRILANYRKFSTALQSGKMMQFIPEQGIYVYFRYDAKSTVMVAFNSGDNEKELKLDDRYAERTAGFGKGKNVLTNDNVDLHKPLKIPGKTTLVIELEK
jgi:glycosidase